MKKLIFIIPVILITLLVGIVAIAYKKTPTNSGLQIVAAENFYADIANQIAGDKIQVSSILSNPSQDPHEYEATTQDAVNVSNANIIIENGAGYDSFMDKLLSSTSQENIINVAAIAGVNDQGNPHVWYNLEIIKDFALNIKNKLIHLDSTDQLTYINNYSKFISSLSKISNKCNEIKNRYNGTKVIAVERVADYILDSCGIVPIKNDFQKAIEEGNDPSLDALTFFENSLKNHDAKVLIYNSQTESQLTQKEQEVAKENNVPVVSFTETMPADSNYVDWIVSELSNLEIALNNK